MFTLVMESAPQGISQYRPFASKKFPDPTMSRQRASLPVFVSCQSHYFDTDVLPRCDLPAVLIRRLKEGDTDAGTSCGLRKLSSYTTTTPPTFALQRDQLHHCGSLHHHLRTKPQVLSSILTSIFPTTYARFSTTFSNLRMPVVVMCSADIFLGLLAFLFPPLPGRRTL